MFHTRSRRTGLLICAFTQALLLVASSTLWGVRAAEAQLGTVEGFVLVDGAVPLPNVIVDVTAPNIVYGWSYTDNSGHYEVASVPTGVELRVYLGYVPLGNLPVSPASGDTTVTLNGQTAMLDFVLNAIANPGPARNVGYWKHQTNVHYTGLGHAQVSYADMVTYGNRMSHFERLDGEPCLDALGVETWNWNSSSYGDMIGVLAYMFGIVSNSNGVFEAARAEFAALLLNVVSNRLQTLEVISADGATVSQAIQQAWHQLCDGYEYLDPILLKAARDLAKAINSGQEVPAGVIDTSLPVIAFAPRPSPAVGALRVTPNPMANSSTFDFEVASPGNTSVQIFDVSGRLVRTLLDGELPSGRHSAVWNARGDDGRAVANGLYFYRIETPDGAQTARFVVMH